VGLAGWASGLGQRRLRVGHDRPAQRAQLARALDLHHQLGGLAERLPNLEELAVALDRVPVHAQDDVPAAQIHLTEAWVAREKRKQAPPAETSRQEARL